MKRLIDHDSFTGVSTFHDFDHSSGKTIITESQDIKHILKQNKIDANSGKNHNKGDYKHIARIPLTVVMEWKTKHNLDINKPSDLPRIEKLLQSSEYKYLRTCDRI